MRQRIDRRAPVIEADLGKSRWQVDADEIFRADQEAALSERVLRLQPHRGAFRKKIYRTIDELQADLDAWIVDYNEQPPHQGR